MADEPAPLPFPWGVLYAKPNPDGSRKNCVNCMMFLINKERCSIHPKDFKVVAEGDCGYHVFGEPMEKGMPHPGIDPVDPALSGYEVVPGGSSCDICIYYEPQSETKGLCHGVANEKEGRPPQPVQALGCCGRWEGIPEEHR